LTLLLLEATNREDQRMRRKTVSLTFKPKLDGGEWSASSSARFTTGDGSLVLESRLRESQSKSGRCRLQKNISFCLERNEESSVFQTALQNISVSQYTTKNYCIMFYNYMFRPFLFRPSSGCIH